MFNVGDITEINGHKCVITYVNGDNFSYHETSDPTPVAPTVKNAETTDSTTPVETTAEPKRRGRRKKNV